MWGFRSVRLTVSPNQTIDFVKFLGIVIILFCGFLTTFTMLARGDFTPSQVLWMMINVCLPIFHPQRSTLIVQKGFFRVRSGRVNIFLPDG